MNKYKTQSHSVRTGVIAAVVAFVALSIFAGGFIEISRDVGTLRYLRDTAAYLIMNKLAYKLIASLLVGVGAGFVSSMIVYGKQVKARNRVRAAAKLPINADRPSMGRTA